MLFAHAMKFQRIKTPVFFFISAKFHTQVLVVSDAYDTLCHLQEMDETWDQWIVTTNLRHFMIQK